MSQNFAKKTIAYLNEDVRIEGLVLFRIIFGLLLFVSIIRFWSKGWIESLYINSNYHFSYSGFDWIVCPDESTTYLLFLLMAAAALCIACGCFYRIATILFFLTFTYVELIDKAYYLNHYYFVSLISFLLMFLPAAGAYSLDALRTAKRRTHIPKWMPGILRMQLAIVYFFAGFAKLNADWLFSAMPMKIWLPAHAHLPIIGELLTKEWVAYLFSWSGAAYDLTIPFLLLFSKSRSFALVAVVLFHGLTGILFPIGMFPWIMIGASLIFLPYDSIYNFFRKGAIVFNFSKFNEALSPSFLSLSKNARAGNSSPLMIPAFLFLLLQCAIPLRSHFYSGNTNWTEEGFRFSWKVMLIEKAGYAQFKVIDLASCRSELVNLCDYLNLHQQKMMQTQPDMIVQFGQHLEQVYREKGMKNCKLEAEVWVTYNGRQSQLLFDPSLDLTEAYKFKKRSDWLYALSNS